MATWLLIVFIGYNGESALPLRFIQHEMTEMQCWNSLRSIRHTGSCNTTSTDWFFMALCRPKAPPTPLGPPDAD